MIEAVDRYLEMRRQLGYGDKDLVRDMRAFSRFAADRGALHLRNDDAFAWTADCTTVLRRRQLLACIRRMGLYLQAEDLRHEVVAAEYAEAHQHRRRPAPFIYTHAEVLAIMKGVAELPFINPIDGVTYRIIIGVVAATGMRIGETLNLKLTDLAEDALVVRKGKFGKDRLVYLHATTRKELREYIKTRPEALKSVKLFVGRTGRTPAKSTLDAVFRR